MKKISKRVYATDLTVRKMSTILIDPFYLSEYKKGLSGLLSMTRICSPKHITRIFQKIIEEHNELVQKHNELVELFMSESD